MNKIIIDYTKPIEVITMLNDALQNMTEPLEIIDKASSNYRFDTPALIVVNKRVDTKMELHLSEQTITNVPPLKDENDIIITLDALHLRIQKRIDNYIQI